MKVERWIKKIGWTTAMFARQIGVSHQAATKIVRGSRPNPENAQKIIALSNGLVSWDDLYRTKFRKASGE